MIASLHRDINVVSLRPIFPGGAAPTHRGGMDGSTDMFEPPVWRVVVVFDLQKNCTLS